MAAHRYWRAVNLEAYDGGALIALSEFWLLAGTTRVDASATLTSSIAPVGGSLANLKDNDTSTEAVLARGTVLLWDFGGSPQDVTDIRLGASSEMKRFPLVAEVQWSDDAVSWASLEFIVGIAAPGMRAVTDSSPITGWSRGDNKGVVVVSVDGSTMSTSASSGVESVAVARPKREGVLQVEWVCNTANPSGWLARFGFVTLYSVAVRPGNYAGSWVYRENGQKQSANTSASYGASWITGDVIGAVVDFAAGSITFYKNGVSQGVAYTGQSLGDLCPVAGDAGFIVTWSATLRTSGFTYPIAGASAWEDRPGLISTNKVRGRSMLSEVVVVASLGATPAFAGAILKDRMRARPNFLFDPAARGRIIGTVKRKNTPTNMPLARRVRLYRDVDGMLIAETWSRAADGVYQFDYIEEGQSYTAIALDHEHVYRMVGADNLNQGNGTLVLIP